jgi:hypothetical protein
MQSLFHLATHIVGGKTYAESHEKISAILVYHFIINFKIF